MLPIRSAVVFGSDHPQPSFVAPLTNSLVPTVARGDATATFTRATAATVMGYAAGDNAGAAQSLLTVASGEARFQGARRVSEGVWSNVLADGSAIASATLAGVLLEPARTNSYTYSQQFTNAAWGGTRVTVTDNAAKAPDGTTTAALVVPTTEAANHYLHPGPIASAATISIFAKKAGYDYVVILTSNYNVCFNLANGTVGATSGTGGTSAIQTVGDGWYRCSVTTTDVSTSIYIVARPTNASSFFSTAGDGTSGIYLWGAQLEAGAFPTSYIATTTVAVTRNADVLTYPLLHNLVDANGSAYVEFAGTSYANSAGTLIGDGTNGPLAPSSANSGAKLLDGTNTVNGPTGTPSGTIKAASRWSNTSSRVVVNGTAGTVGSYDGSFGIADITLGSGACGTLRNVMLWPRPASDATLIRLTTTVSIPDPLLLLESGSYLLLESGDKIKLE